MIGGPFFVLIVVGILGTGLMAGVFCAFSILVMRGLAALPPAQRFAAMNAINVATVRPAFMTVFTGTAVLSAMITVVTFVVWPGEGKLELHLIGAAPSAQPHHQKGCPPLCAVAGADVSWPKECRRQPLDVLERSPRSRGLSPALDVSEALGVLGGCRRMMYGPSYSRYPRGTRTRGSRPWPIPRGS
ncbi:hypothetical protein [Streptomyces sp. NPDC001250]|uniref:hypothetical protein n=1 Tax=unclassified Streptomyces TaxID=2593676 RepID=UPI003334996E